MKRSHPLMLLTALALLLPPTIPPAAAATCSGVTVASSAGGFWDDPETWSNNQVPIASTDVCIDRVNGVPVTVTVRDAASANQVTVAKDSSLTMVNTSGSYSSGLTATSVANDGTITLTCATGSGVAYLTANGVLGIRNSSSGVINAFAGPCSGSSRAINGNLTNEGTLNVNKSVTLGGIGNVGATITNNGTISVVAGNTLTAGNAGLVFVQNGRSLNIGAPNGFTWDQGTFRYLAGAFPGNPPVVSRGSLDFAPGSAVTPVEIIVANGAMTLLNDVMLGAVVRIQGRATGGASLTVPSSFANNGEIWLDSTAPSDAALLTSGGAVLTNAGTGLIRILPGTGGTRTLNANLTNNGTISVTQSLTIDSPSATSTITNNGNVLIASSAYVTIGNALNSNAAVFNQNGGTLDIRTPDGLFLAASTLNLNGGVIPSQPPLLSNGTLRYGASPPAGSRVVAVVTGNELTSDIPAGQTLELRTTTRDSSIISARDVTNNGTILLGTSGSASAARLSVNTGSSGNGLFTNGPTGTVTFNPTAGPNATVIGRITNQGTLTVSHTVDVSGVITQAGSLTVGRGATLNANGGFVQTAGSTALGATDSGIAVPSNSAVTLQGGALSGAGTIQGKLVNTGGQVSPGASPGILTVDGEYSQGPSGALNIEIGGVTAGHEYDRLVVTRAASLGGPLNVSFVNGFAPAVSDSFVILQAASRTGTFSATNGAGLSGQILAVAYNPTDVTLTAGQFRLALPLILRQNP